MYLNYHITPVIILVLIWSLVWKGLALWKSAQRQEKWWFIVMLVVNSVGILEIIYIFFLSGSKPLSTKEEKPILEKEK
ncbi:MAG: DUF5652 family protein [bacterium]